MYTSIYQGNKLRKKALFYGSQLLKLLKDPLFGQATVRQDYNDKKSVMHARLADIDCMRGLSHVNKVAVLSHQYLQISDRQPRLRLAKASAHDGSALVPAAGRQLLAQGR